MSNKKTLLYIVRYPVYESFNLKAKFDGEINGFRNVGLNVCYVVFDKHNLYVTNGLKKHIIGKTHFEIPDYLHTFFYHDLHYAAINVLKHMHIDYVYWRSAPEWASSYRLASEIKLNGAQLLYEIPTFPPKQELQLSFVRTLFMKYAAIWEKRIIPLIDSYIVIGEDAHGTYNDRPAINIENGVDPLTTPQRCSKTDESTIHLLALASMCYWHGYDRLIRSLAEYKGNQKILIHMVGGNDGGSLPEWKALTKNLGLEDQVIFHGALYGDDLAEMFDLCDLGITSLGRYRNGYDSISELKTREYAMRGLPFVVAVHDSVLENAPDSLKNKKLWMKVANDDSIPDMNAIVSFTLEIRNNPEASSELRKFATEEMSWESQFRKVFN